jgi:hypothetical protein
MAKMKANRGDSRQVHASKPKEGESGINRPLNRCSFLLDIDIAQGHASRGRTPPQGLQIADILKE